MSFIREFDAYFKKQFRTSKEVAADHQRLHELHPSSFPFCGLRQFYFWSTMGAEIPKVRDEETTMSYYTSVGTTVHLVLQDMLGRGKRMLGDWTCLNKACKHKVKLSSQHICPKCGSAMRYDELGVKHGRHIVGHVDGVFKYREGYILVDYKTTSAKKVAQHRQTRRLFPYEYNIRQIESYGTLVQKQYGINILGWMLVYVSRDNPSWDYVVTGRALTLEQKRIIWTRMKTYDKHYHLALHAHSLPTVKDLVLEKPCKVEADLKFIETPYDKCPLRDVCFDRTALKAELKTAISLASCLPLIQHLPPDKRRLTHETPNI